MSFFNSDFVLFGICTKFGFGSSGGEFAFLLLVVVGFVVFLLV
jgi:hypothetical protein